MIDPVMVTEALYGGCRLLRAAERGSARRAGEREHRALVDCASTLPAGADIGEIRADGSRWWIRIPGSASS